MSDTICGLPYFHPPHPWGDLRWCPGDPWHTDPHAWPESAVAQLLAGLEATRQADQKARDGRHFDSNEEDA